jgi:hypothetical protein
LARFRYAIRATRIGHFAIHPGRFFCVRHSHRTLAEHLAAQRGLSQSNHHHVPAIECALSARLSVPDGGVDASIASYGALWREGQP